MSIEEGQKNFAARRKQRKCHQSCPVVLLRVLYYIFQLIFLLIGVALAAATFLCHQKMIAVHVDVKPIMPLFIGMGMIGILTFLLSILAIATVCRQWKFMAILYLIFLVALIGLQYFILFQKSAIVLEPKLINEKADKFWDSLNNDGKSFVQKTFQCCGWKSNQDRPFLQSCPSASTNPSSKKDSQPSSAKKVPSSSAIGPAASNTPPSAQNIPGCEQKFSQVTSLLQRGSHVLFFGLAGLEGTLGLLTLLLVFAC